MDFATIPEVLASGDGKAIWDGASYTLVIAVTFLAGGARALYEGRKAEDKAGTRVGTVIALAGLAFGGGAVWLMETATSLHPVALPVVEAMIEKEHPSLDLDSEQVQELVGEGNKVEVFLTEPESDVQVLGETFAEVDGEAVKVSLAWVVDEWQLLEGDVTDMDEYQS